MSKLVIMGSLVAMFSLVAVSLTMLFVIPEPVYAPSHPVSDNGDGKICIQVITKARNPTTGQVKTFPTPCDVPLGWQICDYDKCKETGKDVKKKQKVPKNPFPWNRQHFLS